MKTNQFRVILNFKGIFIYKLTRLTTDNRTNYVMS